MDAKIHLNQRKIEKKTIIEVKKACDCGTNDSCETHDETHECCEFTCCGKPLVKKG